MQVTTSGRTGSVTQEARRRQLIAAATEVIAETGLAAASFARIAERAGVASTRMISYHFADRTELIEAVFSDVFGRAGEFIEPYVTAHDDPLRQIAGLIEGNARFAAANRVGLAAATEIWRSHRRPDGGRPYGQWTHGFEVELTGRILAAGQAAGAFREFDVRVMALTVRHTLDGLADLIVDDPDCDVDLHIAELVATVERALRR